MSQSGHSHSGGTKAVISVLLLALIAFCLLSIDTLHADHARASEASRNGQNTSASALYLKLATLTQPTTSDVTRALLAYIRKDELIKGITLLDADGQLIAQLGTGNDRLLQNPTASPTARIPIRSANTEIYGHAVIAFRNAQDKVTVAYHYIALLAVLVVMALASIGLLFVHRQVASSFAATWRSHRTDLA